jgi:protein-disulfide isomerase
VHAYSLIDKPLPKIIELIQMKKLLKNSRYFNFKIPKFNLKDSSINTILAIALALSTFLLGMLTNKVIYLERALEESATRVNEQAAQPQAEPTEDPTPKQVSVDDDPVLGQTNAKVTIVEFSDYQCPFCKRYFDQTFEQVKKEYVDKGLVKIVYRDLPLSFHLNAHKAAQAAQCANDQNSYWEYHDFLFKNQDEWASLTSEAVNTTFTKYASQVGGGLNQDQFLTCLVSEKYKAEVDKDLADAATVGANGTPTFFIGKSSANGTITGTKLVGAQPFSAFKQVIDAELNK